MVDGWVGAAAQSGRRRAVGSVHRSGVAGHDALQGLIEEWLFSMAGPSTATTRTNGHPFARCRDATACESQACQVRDNGQVGGGAEAIARMSDQDASLG